jgi:hypothetical protein
LEPINSNVPSHLLDDLNPQWRLSFMPISDFLEVDSVTKFITILLDVPAPLSKPIASKVRKSAPGKKRRRRGGAEEEEEEAPPKQNKMSAANTY